MIKYTLLCEFQHSFEGWFSDSTSFEKQCKLNLVSCPECGNSAIKRALMTPNLSVSSHKKKNAEHSDISTSRTEDNKSHILVKQTRYYLKHLIKQFPWLIQIRQ